MKKAQTSKKSKAAPKKALKKAPVKAAKAKIFTKPNPVLVELLRDFYLSASYKLRTLDEGKKKSSGNKVFEFFNKIASEYSVKIEELLGVDSTIKISFELPKTKKADYKKVSAKNK